MTFRMVRFGGSVLSCGACDREGKVQRLDIFLHLLEPTTHANALRHMLGLLSRSLAERSAEGATASVAWYVVCSTQHATCYMLCEYRRMGHSYRVRMPPVFHGNIVELADRVEVRVGPRLVQIVIVRGRLEHTMQL